MTEGSGQKTLLSRKCVRCHMFGSSGCLDADSTCGGCKEASGLRATVNQLLLQVSNLESRVRGIESRYRESFQRSVTRQGAEEILRDQIITLVKHVTHLAKRLAMLHHSIGPPLFDKFWQKLPQDVHADIFECNVSSFLADLVKFCNPLRDISISSNSGQVKTTIERLFKDKHNLMKLFRDFQVQRLHRPIQNTELPQSDERHEPDAGSCSFT